MNDSSIEGAGKDATQEESRDSDAKPDPIIHWLRSTAPSQSQGEGKGQGKSKSKSKSKVVGLTKTKLPSSALGLAGVH